MPPSLEAVQMLLPFMKKLALSPRAEQTATLMESLGDLVGPGSRALPPPSPWTQFTKAIPQEGLRAAPSFGLFRERPNVSFRFSPSGQDRALYGSIGPGHDPETAHVLGMYSQGTGRTSTGSGDQPMMNYLLDMSEGPAQREIPFRGMKLSAEEKAQRALRSPEERLRSEASTSPPIPLADKQQAFDALTRLLRKSGFKKMSFEAEAGERPRLYESLTGYKAQPVSETSMGDLLRNFPGRQTSMPPPVASGQPPRLRIAEGQNMTPEGVEYALGLEVGEATAHGLAQEYGPGVYRLTDRGVSEARSWMGIGHD